MKETDLKAPVARLAEAVARNMDFSMQLRPDIQYGATDGARGIVNMEMLLQRLAQTDGPKKFSVREDYDIYDCLNIMPECVKSMEMTRGDKDGEIGTNRPLENTICVTVHHLDNPMAAYAYCVNGAQHACIMCLWAAIRSRTIFGAA